MTNESIIEIILRSCVVVLFIVIVFFLVYPMAEFKCEKYNRYILPTYDNSTFWNYECIVILEDGRKMPLDLAIEIGVLE